MSMAGLPTTPLSSSLSFLQFQHQLQQQASVGPPVFQRQNISMPYSGQTYFQRPNFPTNGSLPPMSSASSSWSPYFLFARGPQPFISMADTHASSGLPSTSRSVSGNMATGTFGMNNHKDSMLNSSIESLRIRARQHSASLGYYEWMDGWQCTINVYK